MPSEADEWRPGSFTKNFSWGPPELGLYHLHEMIRVGFEDNLSDVPRNTFRNRVERLGRPDYIAINFFLFNKIKDNSEYIVADELVYQALNFPHSERFDRLAIFAFNLSIVGRWKGSRPFQNRPALWAHYYVSELLGPIHHWDTGKATANDIQRFVEGDKRYHAEGSRKLATNLAYLYGQANLGALASKKVERWWVDAFFLTLDRVIENRIELGQPVAEVNYYAYLVASGFYGVSGERSIEKDLASRHLVDLYRACGGRQRFDDEAIRERTRTVFSDIENYAINNPDPIGALHRTNLRIIKTLPRVCALLAKSVGFEIFDIDDLENMDTSTLARENIERALAALRERGISPNINSEELVKLFRET